MTRREAIATAIGVSSTAVAAEKLAGPQVISGPPPREIDPEGIRSGQVLVASANGEVRWEYIKGDRFHLGSDVYEYDGEDWRPV